MEAFVGPAPEGQEVNHKNGNPTDNRLANLEYVTKRENYWHSVRIGLRPLRGNPTFPLRGSTNPQAKLTEDDVRKIRDTPVKRGTLIALAKEYGVHKCTVAGIIHGRKWKHLH
jgi:uncharacterized protein YcgL (UPF0745 family)